MDKLFQSTWFIRIISLVLAITLYLFVTVETNPGQNDSRIDSSNPSDVEVLDEVPLDIKIDADEYVVSGVPEHVKVTLEGKTSVLTPIVRQESFNVFVDLRDLEEGSHTVEIESENLPKEVSAFIEPKTIDVQIDKRASEEFGVNVDVTNEDKLPVGYEIGEPEVAPDTVTIISSQEVIDQIAMVKVFLDVTDLKESIRNKELPVSVYDAQGNDLSVRVDPESVVVSLEVERPAKKVPLEAKTTGELPDEYELDNIELDEEIEIFGRRDVLEEIDTITTEKIDLSEIEESKEIEAQLDLPENVAADEEKVNVHINVKESKTFKDVPIDVKGNDNVTFVEPENGKIDVTAIGDNEKLEKMKKSSIKAFIDVKDMEEGKEEKVDISVEGPKDITFKPDKEEARVILENKD